MERQYIRFYVDRTDKLRCIWYKERSFRYDQDGQISHDFPDGKYAVRTVPMKRSCDKYCINKVKYCQTEEEAKEAIDQRLLRNKPATPDTITWNHLFQLARCPKKYVTWFMEYIKAFYGEGEQELMAQYLIKASHKTELMDKWRKEETCHRVCQLFQDDLRR